MVYVLQQLGRGYIASFAGLLSYRYGRILGATSNNNMGLRQGGGVSLRPGGVASFKVNAPRGVIQVDVKNAFNTIHRRAIFEELREVVASLEGLLPSLRSFYDGGEEKWNGSFVECSHKW